MNPKLEAAIKAGDVDAARVAILVIADADVNRDIPQALANADEAEKKFNAIGMALFEEDDGRLVMPSEGEWSEALFFKIKGGLEWNFSRNRLVRLQEITLWMHQKRIRSKPSFSEARPGREKTLPGQTSAKRNKWVKYAIVGAAAALAIGVIALGLLVKNR